MDGNGRKWTEMDGYEQKWTEMDRNGQKLNKYGYKWILTFHIIVVSLAFTSFQFVPQFRKGSEKMASVFVKKSSNEIVSMQWPICINGSDETTEPNCLDSWHSRIIINFLIYLNLIQNLLK